MMPTTSVIDAPGIATANRSPPSATCASSGSCVRSSSTWACTLSFVAAEISVAVPLNCIETRAAVSSADTPPLTVSPKGSVTASTPSRPLIRSIALSIASW